ncbi:hypothetical protein GCM10011613_12510 [Cellvibrio zantedeschiae]|uniref:Glucose/Sorbosone dehydrogenase domain-containing protein n=1 Tax=Cellvibrio zantedeschiae TaxID=1237077 RepID=A0ABQ3AZY9_9GAMM|nr:hypothetical protein GCM10011613_12510 [Cellvibrio zantedeschiae]
MRFDNIASANQLTEVLNIDSKVDSGANEMGLLGVAPHPDFINNRYVFLYYTGRSANNDIETRIARYKVQTNGMFDLASELIILRFNRPFGNHLGGQIAFDQQGYLYIASGDGGSGGDPLNMGQNLNELLGKILRIDVDKTENGKNYAIPADNPFANTPNARAEIWAYGLRNPWRFSFDKTTNDLWVGDVGQSAWEEINLITRGGNYGWGEMEGDSCYSGRPQCSTANKIKPLYAISQNSGACSVIGGYVYRGAIYSAAYGKYFYTDYCEHTIRSITQNADNTLKHASYGSFPVSIVSFAQDNQGELLAIGQGSSGQQIYKLQAASVNTQAGSMANKLSDTGCVTKTKPIEAASGLIPYAVNSPLWSDGADKQRYLSLPNNTQITVASNGDFNFPIGSVLMKHFKFGEKFVETRLFTHSKTGWQGFSYEWNDAQTEATLLSGAKDKLVNNVNWHFPSAGQCLECHTSAAGFSLGLETKQLNSDLLYPATQKTANQLTTLAHIGMFSSPLTSEQKTEKLYSLSDTQATSSQKARSYLHTNCANCHQPNGPAPVNIDLRITASLTQMKVCNIAPTAGDLGIVNAKIVAAGDPQKSILLKRMQTTDNTQMPPLAHSVIDTQAVQVVSEWITSLQTCGADQ